MEQPPKLEKRFTIQKDEGVREKVHLLQSVIAEMQKEYPEIVGATLFGSLSSGQASKESDIDAYVFVDYEKAAERLKTPPGTFLDWGGRIRASHDEDIDEVKASTLLKSEHESAYWLSVGEAFRSTAEKLYGSNMPADIRSMLENIKVWNQYVDASSRESYFEPPSGIQPPKSRPMMSSVKVVPIAFSALDAIMTDVGALPENRPVIRESGLTEHFKVPAWVRIVGPMFHLGVGNGVRPYRKYFFQKLLDAGKRGEEMWKEIANFVEEWERGSKEKKRSDFYFPHTLSDAIRTYTPELSRKTDMLDLKK
ncbi:MAG: hypothetical protein QT00_C0003G0008 [archaeon GW2011_AR5]|nr:MAG: hypothetical protein QT00_C0003G0008 [archaeon GW2011_AR5]